MITHVIMQFRYERSAMEIHRVWATYTAQGEVKVR
jgi:hypothetical protein